MERARRLSRPLSDQLEVAGRHHAAIWSGEKGRVRTPGRTQLVHADPAADAHQLRAVRQLGVGGDQRVPSPEVPALPACTTTKEASPRMRWTSCGSGSPGLAHEPFGTTWMRSLPPPCRRVSAPSPGPSRRPPRTAASPRCAAGPRSGREAGGNQASGQRRRRVEVLQVVDHGPGPGPRSAGEHGAAGSLPATTASGRRPTATRADASARKER